MYRYMFIYVLIYAYMTVTALNTILGRWGKMASAKWNFSGEPCSGAAIDSTDFGSSDFNPAIKCDCSFSSGTICHITQLYAVSFFSLMSLNTCRHTF